jgi:hypothetical protein
VSRVNHDNTTSLNFSIYRKPTHTDHCIPYLSNHHISHKLAFFHSSFQRLFSIPLSRDNFEKELRTILQIGQKNGYPIELLRKFYNNKRKKLNLFLCYPIPQPRDETYFSIPYMGPISLRISNILKKNSINVSFSCNSNLAKLLVRNKDPVEVSSRSGVYSLSCDTCGANYVGQTGRPFFVRVKEHLSCIRLNKTESSFANHILDTGHAFDKDKNVKYLHFFPKGRKLNIAENLEILLSSKSPSSNSLNEQLNFDFRAFFDSIKF